MRSLLMILTLSAMCGLPLVFLGGCGNDVERTPEELRQQPPEDPADLPEIPSAPDPMAG